MSASEYVKISCRLPQIKTLIHADMYQENELLYIIRGCVFDVYIGIPLQYKDIAFDVGYRLDLLIENKVIIEIKSVDILLDIHHKQLLTYLKLLNKKLGLLINFNSFSIDKSIIRIVNKLQSA